LERCVSISDGRAGLIRRHEPQIYSSLLVFVTQVLAMRRSLRIRQTLTATHDNAAAWAGIGSATVRVWNQKAHSTSIISVLSAFLYLGNISILHITIPTLFSLQSFNSSPSFPVITHGLPALNLSAYNLSNYGDRSKLW
jgi:hypothetical protein